MGAALRSESQSYCWRARGSSSVVALVAMALLACPAEPRVVGTPASQAPPSSPATTAEAAPVAPWSPPPCGGGALAVYNAREAHVADPVLRGRNLVDHAVTDAGIGVALHLIGVDEKTLEGDWEVHRATITVWTTSGELRWMKRLGPYDPYGERMRTYVEPRLVVTESSVIVAFDARGPIAVDDGEAMAPIPAEEGARGRRYLQLASFALASGELEWSKALDAVTGLRMWMREGRLEIAQPEVSWIRLDDGGRGAIEVEEALPSALAHQIVDAVGKGPDGMLWSRKSGQRESGSERAWGAPAWFVTATPRGEEVHVCEVPCRADAARCRGDGRCSEVDGECVATEESCRAARVCEEIGRCAVEGGSCVATSDDDCRASLACRESGHCFASDAHCVKKCSDGTLSSFCEPEPRTSCENSDDCRRHGRCTLLDGRCVVASAADCRASLACTERGACHRFDDMMGPYCTAHAQADCARSKLCREHGRCSLYRDDTGQGICAVRTPSDCRGSAACRDEGKCSPMTGGSDDSVRCGRDSSDDCRRSKLCTAEGRCRLVSGDCVR